MLRVDGLISEWHDRKIGPGDEWQQAIDHNLETADVILLLVSPDFIASDYCRDKEMTTALVRQEKGVAKVIPIILRPCLWDRTPLAKLQAVPRDGRPVTHWPDLDSAFHDIAKAIERTIKELQSGRARATEEARRPAEEERKRAEDPERRAFRNGRESEPHFFASRARGLPTRPLIIGFVLVCVIGAALYLEVLGPKYQTRAAIEQLRKEGFYVERRQDGTISITSSDVKAGASDVLRKWLPDLPRVSVLMIRRDEKLDVLWLPESAATAETTNSFA